MVDILLATYNGEKYIEPQILSIISQSFKDWHLIIHDDGSSDNTISIIRKWSHIDSRIELIDDGVFCGGAAQNFLHLLKYSEAEFVMFCDQDDIWFDNKIDILYHSILKMSKEKGRIVYSNSYVWYPNDGIKGLATLTYASSLQSLLFLNSGIQGCVAIFDSKVRSLLQKYNGDISMHDHLLHLVAVTLAKISVVNTPLMLYRNHEKNVTGGTRTRILNLSVLSNNKKIPLVSKSHYDTVMTFRTLYSSDLSNHDKKVLDCYLSMPDQSFLRRFNSIIVHRFKLYNSVLFLLLKSFIRPFDSFHN